MESNNLSKAKSTKDNYTIEVRRDFSDENVKLFINLLNKETWHGVYNSPVDRKFECFDSIFSYNFNFDFPNKTVKFKKKQNGWISVDLKEQKRKIIQLSKLARQTNNLELGKLCRDRNKVYKRNLVTAKQEFYSKKNKEF